MQIHFQPHNLIAISDNIFFFGTHILLYTKSFWVFKSKILQVSLLSFHTHSTTLAAPTSFYWTSIMSLHIFNSGISNPYNCKKKSYKNFLLHYFAWSGTCDGFVVSYPIYKVPSPTFKVLIPTLCITIVPFLASSLGTSQHVQGHMSIVFYTYCLLLASLMLFWKIPLFQPMYFLINLLTHLPTQVCVCVCIYEVCPEYM